MLGHIRQVTIWILVAITITYQNIDVHNVDVHNVDNLRSTKIWSMTPIKTSMLVIK